MQNMLYYTVTKLEKLASSNDIESKKFEKLKNKLIKKREKLSLFI